MSVDTLTYAPNDVALAIQNVVEIATDDLDFGKLGQTKYQLESDARAAPIQALGMAVARLFGITERGNPHEGDEDAAEAFQREMESYKADPNAFIARFDANFEDNAVDEEVSDVPAADSVELAPVEAFEQVAPVNGLVPVKEQKISFVDRPAAGLFNGVGNDYATEIVPTARWHSPRPQIPAVDPHYCFDGHAVKVMASAIRRGKNVIAVGDPGCGKTEFFKQFARSIGLPFHKIPFDGSLSRAEIIGSFRQIATPTGSATPFVLGLIPRLIQQPGIICLDEVDQADPDIQYMLHSLYEGEGLTIQEEGGLFIPRHEHCYIVATANTKGRGSENGLTNAKYEMSEATRDRYPYWLNFTYMDKPRESATIVAKSSIKKTYADKLVDVATSIRDAYKTGTIAQPCSLRQLLEVAELSHDFSSRGEDVAFAIACSTVIVGRANDDDANTIRDYVTASFGVDLSTMRL